MHIIIHPNYPLLNNMDLNVNELKIMEVGRACENFNRRKNIITSMSGVCTWSLINIGSFL